MQPASDNVIILDPGEITPPGYEDAIKLTLIGSIDTRPDGKFDWARKFIQGLVELTDPLKGILQYRGLRFIIGNTFFPSNNPEPTIQNPEFISKIQWTNQLIHDSDIIFCNFLKRSQAPIPLFWFGMVAQSGKLVVRCPDEYMGYGLVQTICQCYNIPLMPGKVGSVLAIVQAMDSISDVFKSKQDKNTLPE